MVRVIIVDDNTLARQGLRDRLQELFGESIGIVAEASSRKMAIEVLSSVPADLVFLDMDLIDGTGFDVLDGLHKIAFAVIFATSYNNYAVEAIKYSPVGYIVKPILQHEFRQTVQYALANLHRHAINQAMYTASLEYSPAKERVQSSFQAGVIAVQNKHGERSISTEQVVLCVAQERYTYLHCTDGSQIFIPKKISDLESELAANGFVRVHRSTLLNLFHLQEIHHRGKTFIAQMSNGETTTVSAVVVEHVQQLWSTLR
jgi:two-component system, LytTR family, response regulator